MTARPATGRGRTLVALAAVVSIACGAPLMKLPSGPGGPAPDAADLLAQATSACRSVRTFTAEIAVSGSVGGRRTRGRLAAGLAAPASARLEAFAPFGPPLFIFAATGDEATVLLSRDARVLEQGRPDAVLEAIAGVPLGAAELRATLTACTTGAADAAGARRLGDPWRAVPVGAGHEVYLHREGAPAKWRLVATVRHAAGPERGWRAEYGDFENDLPRTVRVTSESDGPSGFDLRLALSQVETNRPLDADVFRIQIPQAATAITLEDLRQWGPLAEKPPNAHAR